ncbi:Pentatricopeptide repeat-containing protein [Artemisia annua]|uniref:Pentatricopeptide repeat-containing protein n=1 Tax=Artemisia annua TaxID=35608 RepID=A0A2U1QKY0_ARTAN|nr:Pentatricopeptide repeat-containing protein [Artemisia annua]
MASSSSNNNASSNNRSRYLMRTLPTHCNCNLRLARRISRFLVCPRPSSHPQRCDDFFWIDGELYSDWYKHTMNRLYVSMSSQQREVFEDDVHSHQMEVAIAVLEERVARMVDEIQTAKSNVASWRKTCYAQNGRDEEALRLLIDMRRYGLRSDQYTLVSILAACSSLASLIEGKQIHPIIIGIIGLLY